MIARRPGAAPIPSSRDRFQRRRGRLLGAAATIVAAQAAVGWLLLAPNDLAALRLFGVSLAWWAALSAHALGVAALLFGLNVDPGRRIGG